MTPAPQRTSNHCYRISESRQCFRIPSSCAHRLRLIFDQAICQQSDQRKQTKKDWRCTRYSQITPLPLRLQTEMRPRFFEGHLLPPTSYEPSQDLQRCMVGISTEKRLRLQLALWVTHQYPTYQDRLVPRFVPQADFRIDLHLPA